MSNDMSKILIIGDLHISDRFSGRHLDYLENCFECLEMITQSIKDKGITHLICLGDWIGQGQAEKNLNKRPILLRLMQVLQEWNELTNNNVYSLKGNHDIGRGMTDYDFLVGAKLLKHAETLDIQSCRFHLFDYGSEDRMITIDEDKSNIGCFHTNLLIEGLTSWYQAGVGRELSTLHNLSGIEYAIAGHIHNPSPRVVSTSILGNDINLFYPGCITRPKYEPNLWDHVFGVIVTTTDNGTALDFIKYDLKPFKEIFKEEIAEEESGIGNLDDIRKLSETFDFMQNYDLNSGLDYVSQIKKIAGLDLAAANLALKYVEEAEAQFKK